MRNILIGLALAAMGFALIFVALLAHDKIGQYVGMAIGFTGMVAFGFNAGVRFVQWRKSKLA